jgi:hypothetical protein
MGGGAEKKSVWVMSTFSKKHLETGKKIFSGTRSNRTREGGPVREQVLARGRRCQHLRVGESASSSPAQRAACPATLPVRLRATPWPQAALLAAMLPRSPAEMFATTMGAQVHEPRRDERGADGFGGARLRQRRRWRRGQLPRIHDCPAVMGLRLVFVSGGGSPWFNSIGAPIGHRRQQQEQEQEQEQEQRGRRRLQWRVRPCCHLLPLVRAMLRAPVCAVRVSS